MALETYLLILAPQIPLSKFLPADLDVARVAAQEADLDVARVAAQEFS
jgi:hypothetical protein